MSRVRVGHAGFTLVEALAAVALAGIVAGAALGVLFGQRSFYAGSSRRTHAQQSARAGADLLYAELRTSTASDLMAAGPDSVSVRADLLRAVVCGPTAGPGSPVALFVYDSVANANLRPRFRGWSHSNPYSGAWRHRDGARLPGRSGSGRAACVARGAPAGEAGWRYRTASAGALSAAFDSVPARGVVLTRYGRVTFSIRRSGSAGSGAGIYRNGQELVAPFRSGAAFRYRMADGSLRPAVPAGELAGVRSVGVTAAPLGPRGRRAAGGELRLEVRLAR